MDEIKPVAFANPQAFVNFRERGHLGGVYGREWMWAKHHPECVPLYDQQVIDTLRGDYARAEELALQAIEARKEAEAEADALRKDAERYRWLRQNEDWTLDGIVRWQEGYEPINASHEVLDAAIDIARQEKQ